MLKRSMPVPSGVAARAARSAVLMVSGALALGLCWLMDPLVSGSEAPNKQVRVESREEALTRADQVREHVVALAGLEWDPWSKLIAFHKCSGPGTGIADEGEAYLLNLAIRLKATDDQRPEVLRALRQKLADEGFKITSNESASADQSTWEFQALQEPDSYTVLAGKNKPGQGVAVIVTLPCQAPPNAAASPAPTPTA
ncbi:hypothetical protein ACFWA9_04470 [Kitasatospora sp. NPDC059973]|uniref:hypothetical protein n=1 Tax=Kitasatospora sp. NPDC059973 TaxID=3347020 RepID=UPI0036A72848